MKLKYASIAALVVALTGCGGAGMLPQPPAGRSAGVPFDPAEIAWSKGNGPNTVEGSAVLRTRGGEARTCAGDEASLVPYSQYAAARMRLLYGSEDRGFFSTEDAFISGPRVADDQYTPAYNASWRPAACDAQGSFVFANVPDGTYFVVAKVMWIARYEQGGWLMQKVEVKGGETKKVVLTQ